MVDHSVIPFSYLDIDQVLAVGPHKSKSRLYAAINAGEFPAPDKIGGGSRWRSDKIAECMVKLAEAADAERETKAAAARSKGQRMLAARRAKEQAEKAPTKQTTHA